MTEELDPERLRQLLDEAARLPRSVEPDRDHWPAIRDRIEAQRVVAITPGTRPTDHSRRPAWLAAAAVLLVTVSSAVTVLVFRSGTSNAGAAPGEKSSATTSPTVVAPSVIERTPVPAVRQVMSPSVDEVFSRYDGAAADLAAALADRRSRLDPRTLAVLDSCLLRIDRAIAEARTALRRDPRNDVITELLTVSYHQKLDLLRRTANLPQGSN